MCYDVSFFVTALTITCLTLQMKMVSIQLWSCRHVVASLIIFNGTLGGRPELSSFSQPIQQYTRGEGVKGCHTLFKMSFMMHCDF